MKALKRINTDSYVIRDILAKSLDLKILNLKEVSNLIALEDDELWDEVFETARIVKEKVYGNRIVLFAPLYISNKCVNNCVYCGFRKGNKKARRKSLSVDEAVQDNVLLNQCSFQPVFLSAHRGFSPGSHIGDRHDYCYSHYLVLPSRCHQEACYIPWHYFCALYSNHPNNKA